MKEPGCGSAGLHTVGKPTLPMHCEVTENDTGHAFCTRVLSLMDGEEAFMKGSASDPEGMEEN